MTGSEQLNCEALHWRYIRRYRPQLARLAHGMAGGGSRDDFRNPEFVQEWSCFIFYVLNTDPQKLVYNEISKAGFKSLIYDYKQVTEGKTGGIGWWKIKSTKSRP